MQDGTANAAILTIAFIVLALAGGACIAAAVHSDRRIVRGLYTMLACGCVLAFAATIAIVR